MWIVQVHRTSLLLMVIHRPGFFPSCCSTMLGPCLVCKVKARLSDIQILADRKRGGTYGGSKPLPQKWHMSLLLTYHWWGLSHMPIANCKQCWIMWFSRTAVLSAVFLWLYVCVLSCFSHFQLFATLWTIALQAPLSLGSNRQEYWSG